MFALISNVFGYLLNFLYELLNSNFGFAIIVFSIILRLILLPITIKQQKSMQKTNKIQGEIKKIQVKYKNNPEMLNKETMELYKREKISPFSGCLSAIAQILIILSVFYMVSQPLTYMKKANNSNPELKSVVDEYKNQVSENSNGKTRYIEIATIARMKEDYDRINEELSKENVQENQATAQNGNGSENITGNEGQGNTEQEQQEVQTEETVTENSNVSQDGEQNKEETAKDENRVEVSENSETSEAQGEVKETREMLEQRKEKLEKLNINMNFLGLDLSKVPSENMNDFRVYIIPALYVISSFISIKLTTNMQNKEKNKMSDKGNNDDEVDAMAQMNKNMSYMMPIMAVSIAFIAPLGLALYWFISNALMIAERFIIKNIVDNKEEEVNG